MSCAVQHGTLLRRRALLTSSTLPAALPICLLQALVDALFCAISRKGVKMYRSDGDIIMPTLCEKVRRAYYQVASAPPCSCTATATISAAVYISLSMAACTVQSGHKREETRNKLFTLLDTGAILLTNNREASGYPDGMTALVSDYVIPCLLNTKSTTTKVTLLDLVTHIVLREHHHRIVKRTLFPALARLVRDTNLRAAACPGAAALVPPVLYIH